MRGYVSFIRRRKVEVQVICGGGLYTRKYGTTQPHGDDRTPTFLTSSIQVSFFFLFFMTFSLLLFALCLSVSFKAALSLRTLLSRLFFFSITALYNGSFRLAGGASHSRFHCSICLSLRQLSQHSSMHGAGGLAQTRERGAQNRRFLFSGNLGF